jgi:hypothetical protein
MKKAMFLFALVVSVVVVVTIFTLTPHLLKTGSQWLDFLELMTAACALLGVVIVCCGVLAWSMKDVKIKEPPKRDNPLPKQTGTLCDKCKTRQAVCAIFEPVTLVCETCNRDFLPSAQRVSVLVGEMRKEFQRYDRERANATSGKPADAGRNG